MGLTTFSGDFPTAKDIGIAKNYLTEDELRILNGIVSGYFDFAEVQAMRHRPMYMSDSGEKLLTGTGKVSHKQAMSKAKEEYQRFLTQNLSPVEEAYLQTIKAVEKTAQNASRNMKSVTVKSEKYD